MVVYSFYIFDRHADCVYKRRWLPATPSAGRATTNTVSEGTVNGSVVRSRPVLSAEDDAKLMFGTVFSLRNMIRKLGGEDDTFLSYRTSQYKLHYYETPTNVKFVMLTDTKSGSMRIALHQIYVSIYVEYVVKNPLSPVEHGGPLGLHNELFEEALEQFVKGLTAVRLYLGSSTQFTSMIMRVLSGGESQHLIRSIDASHPLPVVMHGRLNKAWTQHRLAAVSILPDAGSSYRHAPFEYGTARHYLLSLREYHAFP